MKITFSKNGMACCTAVVTGYGRTVRYDLKTPLDLPRYMLNDWSSRTVLRVIDALERYKGFVTALDECTLTFS